MTVHWNPEKYLDAPFFDVAQQVYQGDAHWGGESELLIRDEFSQNNDFFKHGKAWVGYNAGARLAGFVQQSHTINDQSVAYFGYWESENNIRYNRQLFVELSQWAKLQGAKRLYGPINFTIYNPYRLRLDGFNAAPFLGEPYNPDYYPQLLCELGFHAEVTYQSRFHRCLSEFANESRAHYLHLNQKLDDHFYIKPLTNDLWVQRLQEVYELVEIAFKNNFGFQSISFNMFRQKFGEAFIKKACNHSSVVVFDRQHNLAGFFVAFPDQNKANCVYAKTAAVHPKYHSNGVFSWMTTELIMRAAGHYEEFCAAMIRYDNRSMGYASRLPEVRQYALYSKAL